MTESQAAEKADAILLAALSNQPELMFKGQLSDVSGAQETAKALAAFRQQLMQDLLSQSA